MSLRTGQPAREKGAALFLAILTLFILTIMGIALMFATSIENTLAGTETKVSKIFYAADSGVEYVGAWLSSNTYDGGTCPSPWIPLNGGWPPQVCALPVGVSSHYASLSSPDMQVSVSSPVIVGFTQFPGESLESGGQVYGSGQTFYEIVYALTSSASSTATQATKAIDAEVGIYPKQLNIPKSAPTP